MFKLAIASVLTFLLSAGASAQSVCEVNRALDSGIAMTADTLLVGLRCVSGESDLLYDGNAVSFVQIMADENAIFAIDCNAAREGQFRVADSENTVWQCHNLAWVLRSTSAGTGNVEADAPLAAGALATGEDGAAKIKTGGDATLAGKLTITLTTEQFRLAFDGSNFATFKVSSSGDLRIDATGNVGFGLDPTFLFHVEASTGERLVVTSGLNRVELFPLNGTHAFVRSVRRGGPGNAGWGVRFHDDGFEWRGCTNESGNFYIGQGAIDAVTCTVANSSFYIDTNDDVVIPNGGLDVAGDLTMDCGAGACVATFDPGTSSPDGVAIDSKGKLRLSELSSWDFTTTSNALNIQEVGVSSPFIINKGAGDFAFVLNSSGVGVGTTPQSRLHVNGAVTLSCVTAPPTPASGNMVKYFECATNCYTVKFDDGSTNQLACRP